MEIDNVGDLKLMVGALILHLYKVFKALDTSLILGIDRGYYCSIYNLKEYHSSSYMDLFLALFFAFFKPVISRVVKNSIHKYSFVHGHYHFVI